MNALTKAEARRISLAYRGYVLKQIRELMYEGRSVTEIADILGIKETHVRSLSAKEELR